MTQEKDRDYAALSRAAVENPNGKAVDELIDAVYADLHNVAIAYFRKERKNHTLQPTALVHEAYLRLLAESKPDRATRSQFIGAAARAMRQALIDHARGRNRQRRGGERERVLLASDLSPAEFREVELIEFSDALDELSRLDARQARIVELRFFGGLTVEEVAEVLAVSKRSVEGDWTHAKAWLRSQFDPGAST